MEDSKMRNEIVGGASIGGDAAQRPSHDQRRRMEWASQVLLEQLLGDEEFLDRLFEKLLVRIQARESEMTKQLAEQMRALRQLCPGPH